MTTSRLTLRSLPTRSSSLDLASGRITYRSKSKLTVDAVVTFSALGAGAGAGGGGGVGRDRGAGAGAGAGAGGAGSGVAAQPANASRTIADSAVLSLLFMVSSRRWSRGPRLEQLRYALRNPGEFRKTPALSFCFCCQLILPQKNTVVQAAIFESHEFFFPEAGFSSDPYVRHVLASGRIHQMRNRVVTGGELRFVEGDRTQVGRLARREGPDRGFQAERAGAVQGGRGESLMRRHRLSVVPHRLGEQRGGAHLLEQVQAVVARRPVGADADVDPAREHC